MTMRWHDLLFLHWPLAPDVIRPMIPEGLELDTFEGSAWIGIVAFRTTGMRRRYFPRLAALAFPEVNVRTYVWSPGRSGVWFFSVDAGSRVAVRAAQLSYGLPYYDARIAFQSEGGAVRCRATRLGKAGAGAELNVSYKPTGAVYRSAPETLERWLTDRYCLYSVDRHGQLGYMEIHHAPWPLQHAEAEVAVNTMTEALAIKLPRTPPLAHFAGDVEVIAWSVVPIDQ
jgi:uncharacterized protein YqjF (DUF2071 family)